MSRAISHEPVDICLYFLQIVFPQSIPTSLICSGFLLWGFRDESTLGAVEA